MRLLVALQNKAENVYKEIPTRKQEIHPFQLKSSCKDSCMFYFSKMHWQFITVSHE